MQVRWQGGLHRKYNSQPATGVTRCNTHLKQNAHLCNRTLQLVVRSRYAHGVDVVGRHQQDMYTPHAQGILAAQHPHSTHHLHARGSWMGALLNPVWSTPAFDCDGYMHHTGRTPPTNHNVHTG